MITIIFKVLGDDKLASLKAAAEQCNEMFGGGGNPESEILEATFSEWNTPISNGYIRIAATEQFGTMVEQAFASQSSEYLELVKVEWDGQEAFVTEQTEPVEMDDMTTPAQDTLLGYMWGIPHKET